MGREVTPPRWHYAAISTASMIAAAIALALLLSGCTVRQRLHITTAADLATTHRALQEPGAYEVNPIFNGMDTLQMALSQAAINEGVLWWERRSCRNPQSMSCIFASSLRRGLTAGHAFGAGWNIYQIQRSQD